MLDARCMCEWIVSPNAGSRRNWKSDSHCRKQWAKVAHNEWETREMNWIELNRKAFSFRYLRSYFFFLFSLQLFGCCRCRCRFHFFFSFYFWFLTHFEKNSFRSLEHHEFFRMKRKKANQRFCKMLKQKKRMDLNTIMLWWRLAFWHQTLRFQLGLHIMSLISWFDSCIYRHSRTVFGPFLWKGFFTQNNFLFSRIECVAMFWTVFVPF